MKRSQQIFSILFAIFFSIGSFLVVDAQEYIPAQTVDEVEDAIDDVNERIRALEEEIAEFRGEVVKLDSKQQTLRGKLDTIELERKKLTSSVDLTDEKITETQLTLNEVREGIDLTEREISTNRKAIAQAFRDIHEFDDFSLIEMVLSDYHLSEIFERRQALRSLQSTLDERIIDLRFLRADLNVRKREFLSEQEELQDLREQILAERKLVEESKQEQVALLRETQYEESRFQNLIAEREALRKAFEQELFEYESKLTFLLDPKLLPARGSAPLSWPLDNIVITQLFGVKTGPHRIYANGHSGIDFRGNGDPVYAMADGVVQGTGDTDVACHGASFGKWILVDFDNNLAATYGHLSIISVQTGQKVRRGQLIGYSGNTGRTTAPHLHVTVYAGVDAKGKTPVRVEGKESQACKGKILVQPRAPRDAYLDPIDYLPLTTDANYKAGVR